MPTFWCLFGHIPGGSLSNHCGTTDPLNCGISGGKVLCDEREAARGRLLDSRILYQRKKTLYNLWDQWLLSSDKGRAAKATFPSIWERLKCNWVDPTGDSIRILSGHGPFESYLHDRNLSQHRNCPTDGLRDDPNHAVYDCFDVPDTVCDARKQVKTRSLSEAVRSKPDWLVFSGAFRPLIGCREAASLVLRQTQ